MKLSKTEHSFIDAARVARVATVGEDGEPHNVPICPLLDEERIYFGAGSRSKKVLNLREKPRIAILFDEYTEAWEYLRGILLVGNARIVDKSEFLRLREKLYQKYLAYPETAPLEEDESVIVEVVPERKASWGFA